MNARSASNNGKGQSWNNLMDVRIFAHAFTRDIIAKSTTSKSDLFEKTDSLPSNWVTTLIEGSYDQRKALALIVNGHILKLVLQLAQARALIQLYEDMYVNGGKSTPLRDYEKVVTNQTLKDKSTAVNSQFFTPRSETHQNELQKKLNSYSFKEVTPEGDLQLEEFKFGDSPRDRDQPLPTPSTTYVPSTPSPTSLVPTKPSSEVPSVQSPHATSQPVSRDYQFDDDSPRLTRNDSMTIVGRVVNAGRSRRRSISNPDRPLHLRPLLATQSLQFKSANNDGDSILSPTNSSNDLRKRRQDKEQMTRSSSVLTRRILSMAKDTPRSDDDEDSMTHFATMPDISALLIRRKVPDLSLESTVTPEHRPHTVQASPAAKSTRKSSEIWETSTDSHRDLDSSQFLEAPDSPQYRPAQPLHYRSESSYSNISDSTQCMSSSRSVNSSISMSSSISNLSRDRSLHGSISKRSSRQLAPLQLSPHFKRSPSNSSAMQEPPSPSL